MTPQEKAEAQKQADSLLVEFANWQERRVSEYNKRITSILEAWGIRLGKA